MTNILSQEMCNSDLQLILKALEFASKVHKHQKRTFNSEPYINHPIRIANNPEVIKYGPTAICVALMHDCIEDGEYPEEVDKYIKENFPNLIYETIKLLTHNRLEKSYSDYIENIMTSGNELAIVVKYADSFDNSIPTSAMDEKWIERCKTYRLNSEKYLNILKEIQNARIN